MTPPSDDLPPLPKLPRTWVNLRELATLPGIPNGLFGILAKAIVEGEIP